MVDFFDSKQVRAEMTAYAFTKAVHDVIETRETCPAEMENLMPGIEQDLQAFFKLLPNVRTKV